MKAGGGENGERGVEVQYLPCVRDLVMAYNVTPTHHPILGGLQG